MWPSHRNKQLIAGAITILIIAVAANEGLKDLDMTSPKSAVESVAYPEIPFDIDPKAFDAVIDKPVPDAVKRVMAQPVTPRPAVSAEAYLVANLDTGEVYSERNTDAVFPIASISKLVTALVALRSLPPEQKIAITQQMLDAYGPAGKLVLGDMFTVGELIYPLLLESSNDAAEALALSLGYPDFIQKMNQFVLELDMRSTSFLDPSGMSPGNVSNARDLFKLARHIYANEKDLLDLSRRPVMTLASTTDHGPYTWNTINPFPFDPHFIGGKTGRTNEAKESMISLFRYTSASTSYPVAIIVLRSDFTNREVDSSYLFQQFMRKIEGR